MDDSSYERGVCQDCKARIQPYGPSSRCGTCTERRQAYIDSLWGLDELIQLRMSYEALGLCFHCGDGLDASDGRLCVSCTEQSDQGRWFREMDRRGGKPIEENPYRGAWDYREVDNATYLTPTLGTMADRMSSKARHFRHRAERGGPRGREDAQQAVVYQRIAKRLQRNYLNIAKYQ